MRKGENGSVRSVSPRRLGGDKGITQYRSFPIQAVSCRLFNPVLLLAALAENRDELLAFYGIPVEHWLHRRITNPVQPTCEPVPNCAAAAARWGLHPKPP